jgi:transposase
MNLWVAVTSVVSVFFIRASRGAKVAKEILGEGFAGIVGSDRWSGYAWVDPLRRQLCWAHLIRDFIKIQERGGQAGEIGDDLLFYTRAMFKFWNKVRDGTFDRQQVDSLMKDIRVGVECTLQIGTSCGSLKTERTCKRILTLKHALWVFISTPGIEPTNNVAEQTLRDYVIWRKISLGTQSERGNLFVERLMTANASCKQQGRDVVEFITSAVQNDITNKPAPSLLSRT